MRNLIPSFLAVVLALPFASVYPLDQAPAGSPEELVQQLREFPAAFPGGAPSNGSVDPVEERREKVYAQLRGLGQDALPALARGLSSSDVQIRRNVALFLGAVNRWPKPAAPEARVDTRRCLPELTTALGDTDGRVRELAAQAIGRIGADAAPAVPALVGLLKNPDEGSRNTACIALTGIGPAAKEALPALRTALADPSANVRQFAQRAIDKIEGR